MSVSRLTGRSLNMSAHRLPEDHFSATPLRSGGMADATVPCRCCACALLTPVELWIGLCEECEARAETEDPDQGLVI